METNSMIIVILTILYLYSIKPVVGLVGIVVAVIGLGLLDHMFLEEIIVPLQVFILETRAYLKQLTSR